MVQTGVTGWTVARKVRSVASFFKDQGRERMWDFGMLAIGAAFFFVATRYTSVCDGLRKKEEKQ